MIKKGDVVRRIISLIVVAFVSAIGGVMAQDNIYLQPGNRMIYRCPVFDDAGICISGDREISYIIRSDADSGVMIWEAETDKVSERSSLRFKCEDEKVWFEYNDRQGGIEWLPMYDFSLTAGDVLRVGQAWVVNSHPWRPSCYKDIECLEIAESKTFPGVNEMKIRSTTIDSNIYPEESVWLCGIGSPQCFDQNAGYAGDGFYAYLDRIEDSKGRILVQRAESSVGKTDRSSGLDVNDGWIKKRGNGIMEEIEVFDSMGKMMLRQRHKFEVSLESLNPGVYIIVIDGERRKILFL